MSFTINVTNRVRVRLLWLDAADQQVLGDFAVSAMKRRIAGGIGVNDQPVPLLGKAQKARKVRLGLPGIRDLSESGAMLANLQVIETGDQIRIGFPDPRQAYKAGINQARAPQIGLSRFDQSQVIAKHDELLLRSLADIIYKVAV